MATYHLDRLNVLLVEDNGYIRNILYDMLNHLGVGHIATAESGKDAIEFLKLLNERPQAAGVLGIDIIISDLLMSPIDGLLFLEWVRNRKDSPNRFVPFIMLSGAADIGYVTQARDKGVTEFLAKPFSAQSVWEKLAQVIEHPRPFIATQAYFGPDRRRQRRGPPEAGERRVRTDDDITWVYSADQVVKPRKPSDVWVFQLPNNLRDKVAGVGAKGPPELPQDVLEQAEEALQREAQDFADWAINYVKQLHKAIQDARDEPERRRSHFDHINMLAHELRGQGGTFGYPLITVFAKSLYDFTQPGCREDDDAVEVVKAHADAMRAVIRDRVKGDGGKVGKDLYKGLQAAIKKYSRDNQEIG